MTDPTDFHFLPGSLKALRLLAKNGIKVIIVANQAGVSKGYFTRSELALVSKVMLDDIRPPAAR